MKIWLSLQDRWRRFLSARHSRKGSFKFYLASFAFHKKRGDYYRYLADTIEGTQGKKKLRKIFQDDAVRFGNRSRGVLSQHWSDMFDLHGGRLGKVFEGTFPNEEVMLLRLIQQKGGDAILPEGLRDLSETVALMTKARSVVKTAVFGFAIPLAITVVTLAILALYSVPKLREMADGLSAENLPISVQSLFAVSDFVTDNVVFVTAAAVVFVTFLAYTFNRWTGPVRWALDKYGLIWSIHRDFQAVKFLSNLSLVIKTRNSKSDNLKEALEHLLYGASHWRADVIQRMLDNLMRRGMRTKDVFKVGMLSEELEFDLEDWIESRGLNDALEYLRPRLEYVVLNRLQDRCNTFKWVMIALSVSFCLYLFLLQMTSLREVQEAVARYYLN